MLHHQPSHALGARRRRQRSFETVVGAIGGQQRFGRCLRPEVRGAALQARHGCPRGGQGEVLGAFLEHHRDNREMVLGVGMHQMRLHRECFAVDMVLAGRVEVELLQAVFASVQRDGAACIVVDLNGMAVVHLVMAARLIVEADPGQIGVDPAFDVDRRLSLAGLAGDEMRVDLAPVFRAVRARVAPVCTFAPAGDAGAEGQGQGRDRHALHGVSRSVKIESGAGRVDEGRLESRRPRSARRRRKT